MVYMTYKYELEQSDIGRSEGVGYYTYHEVGNKMNYYLRIAVLIPGPPPNMSHSGKPEGEYY